MKEGKNWHMRVGVLGKVGQYHLSPLSLSLSFFSYLLFLVFLR